MKKAELVFYHPKDPSRNAYYCVEQLGTVIVHRTAPLAQKDNPKKGTTKTTDMEELESADATFIAQVAFRKKRGFVELGAGGTPPKPAEKAAPRKTSAGTKSAATEKANAATTKKPARATKADPREEWLKAPARGGGFAALSLPQRASFEARAELTTYEAPLEWCSLDDENLDARLAALPASTRAIRAGALSAKQVAALGRSSKLEALSFKLDRAAAADEGVLAPVRSLERLRYLCIPGLPHGRLRALLPSSSLRWLSLHDSDSIDDGDVAGLEGLEGLDLEHCPGVGGKALLALSGLRALRLGTSWSPGAEVTRKITDQTLAIIGRMQALRYLSIGNAVRLTEAGVASLTALDLDVLDHRSWGKLGATVPKSKAYLSLLASQKELRELFIECDGVLPPAALAAIARLTKLHTLMITSIAPKDATPFIAAVAKNAALVRLDLTIDGASGLGDLGAALTELDRPESVVLGFSGVPKAEAKKLMTGFAKRHPRCELIVTGD